MTRVKYIGFDLDGTLIDTMRPMASLFGKFMQEQYGVDAFTAGRYFIQTLGTPTSQQISDLLWVLMGKRVPLRTAIRLGELVDKGLSQVEGKVFEEVPTVLHDLKNKGYHMFVSSSHEEQVILRRLKEFDLESYFDFWVGTSYAKPHVKKGKPHFMHAAHYFAMDYNDFVNSAVYVGDSKRDVECAISAGVVSIGRLGTITANELRNAGAVAAIESLSELEYLVENLNHEPVDIFEAVNFQEGNKAIPKSDN